jgi:hypothetical protein
VLDTPDALGAIDEGSKAHSAPDGSFEQLRFTELENPPVAVSVKPNFAAPPGSTVDAPGAALMVKSGGTLRAKKTSCPFASFSDHTISTRWRNRS